jgi:hypothetical protein
VLNRIMVVVGDGSQFAFDLAGDTAPFSDRAGSMLVKRRAITVASFIFHRLWDMSAMVRARLSVASAFGKSAKRPASRQGSRPWRASTEITLNVIPLASNPTLANRKSFRFDRRRAVASGDAKKYP